MTDYKRGDVVLVPFPFSDQTATKKCPAVVISSDKYTRFLMGGLSQKDLASLEKALRELLDI